jgi:sugar lactone lactonase YvrE
MGATLDRSGNLFIADRDNHRIRKLVLATGTITTVAGTGMPGFSGDGGPAVAALLNGPAGLAVDEGGNLLIADRGNHRIRKIDPSGVISTVAGTGVGGFSGDGGPATSAPLDRPTGLALDGNGNLLIADRGNHRIRMVAAGTGVITTVAGLGAAGFSGDDGPAGAALLNGPAGLAVDAAGNLFIADQGNHRVRRIESETGTVTTVAGLGAAGFSGDDGPAVAARLNGPAGLAVDAAGNLFIADQDNHRVRKLVLATGTITTVAGTGVPGFSGDGGPATGGQLNVPFGVAVDDEGNLFLADMGNHRIRTVVLAAGSITTLAGTGTLGFSGDGGPASAAQFNTAVAVAVDPAGNLFVADRGNHRIRRIDRSGIITTVAGTGSAGFSGDGGPASAAQFNTAVAVAVDPAGNLFVADRGNHRIRRIDRSGIITTVAGTGTRGSSGDAGPATSAHLDGPAGLAVDAAGNLFIADQDNHRVRKVVLETGIITTVAGTGSAGFSGDGGPAVAARLNGPAGLAVDVTGNLFITDQDNHRVRKVVLETGIITTVAGTGSVGFSGDSGPASSAQLNGPVSIAVDSSGDLFIADRGNHRIRWVAFGLDPVITGLSVASGAQGTTLTTAISGTNLAGALRVDFGPGIDVTLVANTATSLTVDLTIGLRASPGARPFQVTSPAGTVTSGAVQFTVVPFPVPDGTSQVPIVVLDAAARRAVAEAFDQALGTRGTEPTVQRETGVVTMTAPDGRQFAFLVLRRTRPAAAGSPPAVPGVALDPSTGVATVVAPTGERLEVMGAPTDFQAFLAVLRPLGVIGLTIQRGQFLLATETPGITAAVRLGFALRSGPVIPGVAAEANGTAAITYPGSGRVQDLLPVFADVPAFLAAARGLPGVVEVQPRADGTVTAVVGGQPVALRPEFLVSRSPAGSARSIAVEGGALVHDTGDGRRQRFRLVR